MSRPTFDDVAVQIAQVVAQRSTCPRLHVGAVIYTADHYLVASGYNGSLPGQAHCFSDNDPCKECHGTGRYGGNRILNYKCNYCDGKGVQPSAGCWIENDHCLRTVHAEANAIAQAASRGVSLKACTLYTTASTCESCTKLVIASGIQEIVYVNEYKHTDLVKEMMRASNMYERTYKKGE